MGYQIHYKPIKKIRGLEKRSAGMPAMTMFCFLLFILLVDCVWHHGADILQQLLFSGNVTVTVAALEDMAVELKAGEALYSAVEGFSSKVIQGAKLG